MVKNENGCWYRTFHPLGKEFQKEKFSLTHQPIDDFFKSQVSIETNTIKLK